MNGKNLTKLSEKELRKERQNIGMIFQHFNLLMQRTALDNVCFPMEIAGISKKEARKKALEYLKVVGLEEKALSYPSQLSGGQKQRVAIARVPHNLQGVICSQRILTFNSVLRAANLITHANTMRIIIFLYCHCLIAAPMITIKYYSLSIHIGHGVFMIGLKYK